MHEPTGARRRSRLQWLAGLAAAGLTSVLLLTGCQTAGAKPVAWQQKLQAELPMLGHRNWIVIADSAYPAQTSPGVEVLYTGAGQIEVVDAVLAAVDHAPHVQGVIHLDAELSQVPESLAPGIQAYREALDRRLPGRRVIRLPHEELIAKLDEAGKTFRILILKTDLMIPYTSVFVQLDCGYWGPAAERQLRETISRKSKS